MTANVNNPAFVIQGPTVSLAAAATNQTVRVRAAAVTGSARTCRVFNSSASVTAFIESGPTGAVASATASMPIPPGGTSGVVTVFGLQGDWIAAVVSGTTAATVYFTPGEGF